MNDFQGETPAIARELPSNAHAPARSPRLSRLAILLYLFAVLLLLVYPFTRAVFRDNDQAALLRGGWELARGSTSFWRGAAYNYDKQWGTYLGLALMYRLVPSFNPVLTGNLMQVLVFSVGWLWLGVRTGRNRNSSALLLLPVLASPSIILYAPFLGTSCLSLAFLLIGFALCGKLDRIWNIPAGLLCIFAAAACRGDAVLAMPAFVLAQMSRATLSAFVRRPLPWMCAAAALLPIFVGKWIDVHRNPDTNPFGFDPRAYVALLIFGFTLANLLLLAWIATSFLKLSLKKRRFSFYYAATAGAALIPFGFYSLQLYSIRYFYLTIASLLFIASGRPAALLFRSQMRRLGQAAPGCKAAAVLIVVLPWLVGFNIPDLSHIRLTGTDPTRFPTGDGHYPMGAYLGFEAKALLRDHLEIDHNEKVWLAAQTVDYEPCPDGRVPLLWTPMVNYESLSVVLQGKRPGTSHRFEPGCDYLYSDARSLGRLFDTGGPEADAFLSQDVQIASAPLLNGQPILLIKKDGIASDVGRVLGELRNFYKGSESEVYFAEPRKQVTIPARPFSRHVVFSNEGKCTLLFPESPKQVSLFDDSFLKEAFSGVEGPTSLTCPGSVSGWARNALPSFMTLSRASAAGYYGHPISAK